MAETKSTIPTEFKKVIVDMTKDILTSFPEQEQNLHKDLKNVVFDIDKDTAEESLQNVFDYCRSFYPAKFFDILYQNNVIFEKEESEFLPGINFKMLWAENISDKTRETIWKYLQLVLFTIVSSISEHDNVNETFGDTTKLFEAINENEFKAKLEETIAQMQNLFGEMKEETSAGEAGDEGTTAEEKKGINLDDLPDPKDIHDHVTNMMNGKLGKLAREIAEETAADLNINADSANSVNDVFKNLIHNPSKLLGLVKKVGSKLDQKIKTGDMKESELLEEASELIKKMKGMPGMGDLQSMLSKMGMNMGGKGSGKVNVDAMQTNINQRMKDAKNRERLLKKLTEKKMAQAQGQVQPQADEEEIYTESKPMENLVFSTGEQVERSTRESQTSIKKKKKNKNKK
jgi:hypothetical protein